jgi:hypothetical protein
MKLLAVLLLGLGLSIAQAAEEKDVKVNGKTMEVRVPKSAHVNCKDAANAAKTECKKQPKEMPKVEKPKEAPPADAPAKKK